MTVSTQLGSAPKLGVNLASTFASTDILLVRQGEHYWSDEGLFEFSKSTAGVTAGDLVELDPTSLSSQFTTPGALTKPTNLGVAVATIAALGYGWIHEGFGKLVSGAAGVNSAASTTQDVAIYSSATAGRVTSTAGSNAKVSGLKIITTTAASVTIAPYFATGDMQFIP